VRLAIRLALAVQMLFEVTEIRNDVEDGSDGGPLDAAETVDPIVPHHRAPTPSP
jgi:hypothetical protein